MPSPVSPVLAQHSAGVIIRDTENALRANAIVMGSFIDEGPDWRMIEVDRLMLSPFLEFQPDTLKITRTSGRSDSLMEGIPYLIYLNVLADSFYGFSLDPNSPLLPLSQSPRELGIVANLLANGWKTTRSALGGAGDTAAPSDSLVFLNFRHKPEMNPLIISRGEALLGCLTSGQALLEFTSVTENGMTTRHVLDSGEFLPPLEIPYYGGILLTGFLVSEVNPSCVPDFPQSHLMDALVVFEAEGNVIDTVAFRGALRSSALGMMKRKMAPLPGRSTLRERRAGVDARGRVLPDRGIRSQAIFILPVLNTVR